MPERMVFGHEVPNIEKLRNLSKKLKEEFGDKVKEVILFGSYARGDFTDDSDVDIIVVVDDDRIEKEVRKIAYSFIPEVGKLISVKVIGKKTFESMRKMGFSLIRSIEREGMQIG